MNWQSQQVVDTRDRKLALVNREPLLQQVGAANARHPARAVLPAVLGHQHHVDDYLKGLGPVTVVLLQVLQVAERPIPRDLVFG